VIALPPGACDTHTHALDAAAPHALLDKSWMPILADAGFNRYLGRMKLLGIERAVLQQHGLYGRDNSILLRALAELGERGRGVVHLSPSTSAADLRRWDAAGARAIKVSDRSPHTTSPVEMESAAKRIADLGWHIAVLTDTGPFPDLVAPLLSLPCDVVIDHMGRIRASDGIDSAAFRGLLRLAAHKRCWIKISAPEFLSDQWPECHDLDAMVAAVIDASGGERLLWGTDWPHGTALRVGKPQPTGDQMFALLARWFPHPEDRQRLLVDNPARLYRFPGSLQR
jgi:predicted TIM-barrel fold metal-dependent hydrolase